MSNPSLHPTRYSGLGPLPRAGELRTLGLPGWTYASATVIKICLVAGIVAGVIALVNLARRRWFAVSELATKVAYLMMREARTPNPANISANVIPIWGLLSVALPPLASLIGARRGDRPNARGQAGCRLHEFHLAEWRAGHAGLDYDQYDFGRPGPAQARTPSLTLDVWCGDECLPHRSVLVLAVLQAGLRPRPLGRTLSLVCCDAVEAQM